MATIRAYVFKDQVFGFYKVAPAVVVLNKGDEFELVNTDAKEVTWTVPKDIFDTVIKKQKFQGRSGPKKQKAGLKDVVVAGYEVEADGQKAIGNSDPVIIIDP